jgi:DNA-binding transcriptional LysR family regulator
MDVEGRLLRYFVAVAEELHFTRAAARLYISQPALSKAIAQLERELEMQLVRRTSRQVELTDAGEALLPAARAVLQVWSEGVAGARRARRVLRIGYHSSVGPTLTSVVACFLERCPGWRVELRLASWADATAGLLARTNDISFIRLPVPNQDRLRVVVLRREPRFLAMAASHPLARRTELRMRDLSNEAFVGVPATGTPHAAVGATEVDNPNDWLEAVANGIGVAFAAGALEIYRRPDVVYLPLVDAEPTELAVATRQGALDYTTAEFFNACEEIFGISASSATPTDSG